MRSRSCRPRKSPASRRRCRDRLLLRPSSLADAVLTSLAGALVLRGADVVDERSHRSARAARPGPRASRRPAKVPPLDASRGGGAVLLRARHLAHHAPIGARAAGLVASASRAGHRLEVLVERVVAVLEHDLARASCRPSPERGSAVDRSRAPPGACLPGSRRQSSSLAIARTAAAARSDCERRSKRAPGRGRIVRLPFQRRAVVRCADSAAAPTGVIFAANHAHAAQSPRRRASWCAHRGSLGSRASAAALPATVRAARRRRVGRKAAAPADQELVEAHALSGNCGRSRGSSRAMSRIRYSRKWPSAAGRSCPPRGR